MKIISVINNKGGVAKTTTTIHLGAYLADLGNKVLLIDFDPQCDLSTRIGAKDSYNIIDLLNKKTQGIRFRKSIDSELYTLAGSSDVDIYKFNQNSLKDVLKIFEGKFDYILIDCQPRLLNESLLTSNEVAMIASDYMIIPVNSDTSSIEGVGKILSAVRRINQNKENPVIPLGILFTNVFENEKLFSFFYEKINQLSDGLVFKSYIRKNAEIKKAETLNKTIFNYNKNCSGAIDYKKFAEEFLNKIKENEKK